LCVCVKSKGGFPVWLDHSYWNPRAFPRFPSANLRASRDG
jgi:hypothetical protein